MTDWPGQKIIGAKILVMLGDQTLSYLRDDKTGIAYPGVWDIPGGGLEGAETAREAAVRELEEETGLVVAPERLVPLTSYPAQRPGGWAVAIYRLDLVAGEEALCRFGSEGTRWGFGPLAAFLARRDAVEPLRAAVAQVLPAGGAEVGPA